MGTSAAAGARPGSRWPRTDLLSPGCFPVKSPWVSPQEKARLDQLPMGNRQPSALPEAVCILLWAAPLPQGDSPGSLSLLPGRPTFCNTKIPNQEQT